MRTIGILTLLCICMAPAAASAQYKNSSFGLDAGFWLITKPSITDSKGNIIEPASQRPLRLSNGGRFGGETNFKLDEDHWWFTGGVHVGVLQFAGDTDFDKEAREKIGTLLGVQGSMGIRYVILTDKVRPYIQVGLSYVRLFSFNDAAGQDCGSTGICGAGGTNSDNYLPHPNVGGVHLQPGAEIIISRDIALHFFADLQRWIVFNTADNNSVVLGVGVLFFT